MAISFSGIDPEMNQGGGQLIGFKMKLTQSITKVTEFKMEG